MSHSFSRKHYYLSSEVRRAKNGQQVRVICYQIVQVIAIFLFCNLFLFLHVHVQAKATVSRPHYTRHNAKAIRQSYAYHQLRSCTAVSFLIIHPTTESCTERGRECVEYGERKMRVITNGREAERATQQQTQGEQVQM